MKHSAVRASFIARQRVFASVAFLLMVGGATFAQSNIVFPLDAGIANVKDFGAVGDGVADDTAAIQSALNMGTTRPNGTTIPNLGTGVSRIVYFPNGTYKVSDSLKFGNGFERYMTLQGQSRDGVIIKLVNSRSGFTNAASPKPVITTLMQSNLGSRDQGLDSFRNYIRNLTVDTGAGNVGAVGIDYLSNNIGSIYNVKIKTSDASNRGVAGLRIQAGVVGQSGVVYGVGPALVSNVAVTGFETGIQASPGNSIAFDHITLSGQRTVGVANNNNLLAFRDLVSSNSVPVYQSASEKDFFQVIGGSFTGGSSAQDAVKAATSPYNAMIHLRDVNVAGYRNAVAQTGRTVGAGFVTESLTYPFVSSAGGSPQSLRLPVNDTPDVPWDDPATWANIVNYGAISGDSGKSLYVGGWTNGGGDSAAIQAAIDSGATTVYFPNGVYTIDATIRIRGNVRRIIGMESVLQLTQNFANSGNPVFQFENGTNPVVVLERLDSDYGGMQGNYLNNISSRTLVMRGVGTNLGGGGYVTGSGGTGDLYMEDCNVTVQITRQRAWLRQYNPEGGTPNNPTLHLSNSGGRVWCLGMKTEGVATMLQTTNGGFSELLGGLMGSTDYVPPALAQLSDNNASVGVIAGTSVDPATQPNLIVDETLGGTNRQFSYTDFAFRSSSELQTWNGQYAPSGNWYVYRGGSLPYALRINCGGGASSLFVADTGFSGGSVATNANAIDTSGVTPPAPAAVYNSERWGPTTYAITGLTAGASYVVRLHFCENYFGAGNPGGGGVGSRKFNVAINGTNVLTNFDILAAAGAPRKAIVRQFNATANGSGRIVIATALAPDNPLLNAVEILAN